MLYLPICHPHHICWILSQPAEPPVVSEDCAVLHRGCTVSSRMLVWFSVSALCIHPHISLEKRYGNHSEWGKSMQFCRKICHLVDRVTHLPVSSQQFHVKTRIVCVQGQFEIADRIVTIQIYSPSVLSEEAGAQTVKNIRNHNFFIFITLIPKCLLAVKVSLTMLKDGILDL